MKFYVTLFDCINTNLWNVLETVDMKANCKEAFWSLEETIPVQSAYTYIESFNINIFSCMFIIIESFKADVFVR